MSIIKINAITVPADSGDMLAQRFAKRRGEVDGTDGFEGFELLRPTDDRNQWLVVTRWRDEESFQAWATGDAFQRAHGHGPGEQPKQGEAGEGSGRPHPVGMSAELWSYKVADLGSYDA